MAGMFNMLLRSTVSVLIFTKSVTTLGHDQRCAGCDKTTIEGMCVANWKNLKILLYAGISKILSTKYFMENTRY